MNILTTMMPVLITSVLTQMVVLACVSLLTPRMSRPDLFFSITVNPSLRNSAAGQRILHNFYRSVVLYSFFGLTVVLIITFIGANALLSSAFLVAACLAQWVGIISSYLSARRAVIPHQATPSMEREAAMAPRRLFSKTWWLSQLGPFALLGLAAFCLWLYWDRIPARYPIHWGLDGLPNGWGDRSVGNVFLPPIIGTIVCGFFAALSYGIARGVRRIHTHGPESQSEARNLRNILLLMLGVEYWFAVMFGAMSFLPFISKLNAPAIPVWILAGISVAGYLIVIAVMSLAVRSGQGGWRLAGGRHLNPNLATSAPVGDRTPDACWKGGIIYYNPDDPAIWVEKRFGYGWTLNMATRGAWVVLSAILLLGVVVPVLSLVLLKK